MPRRQADRDARLSSLEEDVLTLLVGRRLCAQEIIEFLGAASDHRLSVVHSTPYSALPRMEEKGLVASAWHHGMGRASKGVRRRYYHLTEHGFHTLQARRSFRARLDTLSTPPGQFLRRTALNRCLSLL